jgi:hypothetical protein
MNTHKFLSLLLLVVFGSAPTAPVAPRLPRPGCTVLYAYDGQVALGGNNEDFNNPLTLVWFIPASPGKYGRVYFGYDDYIAQGGLNDQGVFFDDLALEYKATPLTNARPHYPDGDQALIDQALATSANVQEVIDFYSPWYRPAGEYYQRLYGDRFGASVIFDGDTVLPKQGAFQIATNFRLVEHPDPPYPEERYGVIADMLTKADTFSVELFRQALDAAHAEGDYPTLYSQVYELNTGLIHLYLYHDFEHEVVLNLAKELAKGPHVATIASLFPKNPALEQWAGQQVLQWKAGSMQGINRQVEPSSLAWMSGQYVLQEEAGPVKVYLENDQLYIQKTNQLPIELYPVASNSVFHNFFNGEKLLLTFQRDEKGQATGAKGALIFKPYNIEQPYHLTRTGEISNTPAWWVGVGGVVLGLVVLGGVLGLVRKRLIQRTA